MVGFRDVVLPETSAKWTISKLEQGLEFPLIEGFEEVQREAIEARLRIISVLKG